MLVSWVVLLVVLAWGGLAAARWFGQQSGDRGRGAEGAVEILKRRYASGEMTTEEYEERLKRLA